MKTQFRHSYEVDNRYKGLERAADASNAQNFLKSYIGRLREKGFPRPKFV
jgi:hypothetical protein